MVGNSRRCSMAAFAVSDRLKSLFGEIGTFGKRLKEFIVRTSRDVPYRPNLK